MSPKESFLPPPRVVTQRQSRLAAYPRHWRHPPKQDCVPEACAGAGRALGMVGQVGGLNCCPGFKALHRLTNTIMGYGSIFSRGALAPMSNHICFWVPVSRHFTADCGSLLAFLCSFSALGLSHSPYFSLYLSVSPQISNGFSNIINILSHSRTQKGYKLSMPGTRGELEYI